MIKCIAIDMDGTLLTIHQELTKENERAIKKAQSMGIQVIIATGRSYEEAGFVLKEAGIQCPLICANGAEIRSENHQVVGTNPLGKPLAKDAAHLLKENEVYFEVYTNKGTFTIDKEKTIAIMMDIFTSEGIGVEPEEVRMVAEERFQKGIIHVIDSYEPLFDEKEYEIYKLLAFSKDEEKLKRVESVLANTDDVAVSASAKGNLEITSEKAQKGIALKAFNEKKGINLSEVMAIGDNYNDLSMFKIVGRSVAMGNADDIIKAQCDFVTATNEESGVAKAIQEVLNML